MLRNLKKTGNREFSKRDEVLVMEGTESLVQGEEKEETEDSRVLV